MSFRCGELALPLHQHQTSSASLQKFCIFQRSTADLSSLIFQRSAAGSQLHCIISYGFIAATFTWTSVSACALSGRRYIALFCSYIFSVLLLHCCVLFVFETHRSVLFVVTPSSCCPYNVQSERLLQVSACAFLGRTSTRMPTVHSSKFCFHIVAVCLWSRRPCHVHRERLPHMSVCVCTSWAKLDENADDIYFSSVFIHIVAYYRSVLFVVALSR